MNNSKLSPANIVIMAAGAVMLIASFLSFYEFSFSAFGTSHSTSYSAWSSGLFGIATIVVLCGVVMASQVALTSFSSNVSLPDKVLGLGWDQIHIALGFQAAIMMVAFLVTSHSGVDFGIGFWLMLISAIALLVGAVMRTKGTGAQPNAFG